MPTLYAASFRLKFFVSISYMVERFHEDNPWFIPWSPNASANGRLITMLLKYYS